MTITTWDDKDTLNQIVICDCGVWKLDSFNLEPNDIVMLVAQHWINDHDYDYHQVSQWVNNNWEW